MFALHLMGGEKTNEPSSHRVQSKMQSKTESKHSGRKHVNTGDATDHAATLASCLCLPQAVKKKRKTSHIKKNVPNPNRTETAINYVSNSKFERHFPFYGKKMSPSKICEAYYLRVTGVGRFDRKKHRWFY